MTIIDQYQRKCQTNYLQDNREKLSFSAPY